MVYRLAAALAAALLTAGVAAAQAPAAPSVAVRHTAAGDTLHWRADATAAPLVVWLPRADTTAYLVQGQRRAAFPPDWAKRFRKMVTVDSLERELAAKGYSP